MSRDSIVAGPVRDKAGGRRREQRLKIGRVPDGSLKGEPSLLLNATRTQTQSGQILGNSLRIGVLALDSVAIMSRESPPSSSDCLAQFLVRFRLA